MSGLAYIMWGRLAVLAFLATWVLRLPLERSLFYLLAIIAFGVLSALPYIIARRGSGGKITIAGFILLDAVLLTYLLVAPLPFYVDGWTAQLNLRLPNFFLLGIFLTSMALSYSPVLVLWAGAAATFAWSVAFYWIANLPGSTVTSASEALDGSSSSQSVISSFLDPSAVSLTAWQTQVVFLLLQTLIITLVVWRSRRLVDVRVAAQKQRDKLARYFSPNIVEELSKDIPTLDVPVEQRAAILFADMVGFTELTEKLTPHELVELLRKFHSELAQTAFAHGGTVDKYIGDSIMIHFGTPHARRDDPVRALVCASAMLERIALLSRARCRNGEIPIQIGIGIHYGDVIVGTVGHSRRLEYTALGETVNVANRLERLTRDAGSRIMLSDAVVRAVSSLGVDPAAIFPGLSFDATRHVRGKRGPIDVWSA